MNPSYIDLASVEYIVSNTSIAEAWKKVRPNKGAPGVDKISIEKFFDTVNHDILMDRIGRKVKDKGLIKLLGSFLRAGVVVNGRLQETKLGVPQGSPVSPILSNILLLN